MKKHYLLSLFLISYIFCFGQAPKEVVIVNKNCPSLNTSSFMTDELTISDKEITEYLRTKCPKYVIKTAVEFDLIFLSNTQLCCRRTAIVDPTQISKAQKDTLLKYILNFPNFNKIKIDKPKQLSLLVVFDETHLLNCFFVNTKGTK